MKLYLTRTAEFSSIPARFDIDSLTKSSVDDCLLGFILEGVCRKELLPEVEAGLVLVDMMCFVGRFSQSAESVEKKCWGSYIVFVSGKDSKNVKKKWTRCD